jgi:putative endonuclease
MYFVYIVECSDGSLYTGFTINIDRRVLQHNESKLGAKSIKGKLPVRLVYSEDFLTKSEALKREHEIKGWSRVKKQKLIKLATDNKLSNNKALV